MSLSNLLPNVYEGNYMNNDPEMVRWMYVEDSVFLQMKKQGYHRKV